VLIGLILLGLALVAFAGLMLLRASRPPKAGGIRQVDPQTVEREVYEKLYGERSSAISAAPQGEASGEAGAGTRHARSLSGARRLRTHERRRDRGSHR
jgi:hypothetical protein